MENVFLAIQLIVTLCLIGIVLLQRSEGGGLGMGGGGAMTGRQAANAMTKLTWVFGVAFLVNAVILTVLSAQNAGGSSVIDLLPPAAEEEVDAPVLPGADLLPPAPGDAPLTPPRSE
jgi:preprotein translocase subunit SecG